MRASLLSKAGNNLAAAPWPPVAPKPACNAHYPLSNAKHGKNILHKSVTHNGPVQSTSTANPLYHGPLQIPHNGPQHNTYMENMQLQSYGKSGALQEALALFTSMCHRDHFSWNFIIRAYARHGHGKEALQLVDQLHMEGFIADKFIYVSILSACADLASLAEAL